jgi:hypothetical protein
MTVGGTVDPAAIVYAEYKDKWDGRGTFHVDSEIQEDDTHYLVTIGARELLVGGDQRYLEMGGVVVLVDKTDGSTQGYTWSEVFDRAWRPVA